MLTTLVYPPPSERWPRPETPGMDVLFTFAGSKKARPTSSPSSSARRAVVAWAVCEARTSEVMQLVVSDASHACHYYSDAFNTYRELCWWGEHRAM